ncbi:MAG: sigma-54-dependent Fis family transcriptional regulator, partial [Fibrobacteres bacterium]|nr:sigma-54-dependent Fis family transcriptional regulator [Fibrobacterota bacterium]
CETHYYDSFVMQLITGTVFDFYSIQGENLLPSFCDESKVFLSKNVIEKEHLLLDFAIEKPLSTIRFLESGGDEFLGVISFPRFLTQLQTSNDRALLFADDSGKIFGCNGLLLRALYIPEAGAVIGKKVEELFTFNSVHPLLEQEDKIDTPVVKWEKGRPFPGALVKEEGSDKGIRFTEMNAEFDVYESDFALTVEFVSHKGSFPGVILRGRKKRPFIFPDTAGYVLAKPAKEALQFKRGAEKVRLLNMPELPDSEKAVLRIEKKGMQFDFFINDVSCGSFIESSPLLIPSDNKIFLFTYPEQKVDIAAISLFKGRKSSDSHNLLSAYMKTGEKRVRFNISIRQEILDGVNCSRYQLEDVTELLDNIDSLTKERDELTELLAENRQLGESESMRLIRKDLAKLAPTSLSVLVEGETGTGKEVLARTIHETSRRRDNAFVKIDCSTIPENLMESELFGHEKGAFTGALAAHAGRFEQAQGGTIFLDEVSNLSLSVQAKLLGVIQDRTITRIGGTKPIHLNVRLISASNIPLLNLASEGNFRADLYYRLAEFTFLLPPLRERAGDIPSLAAKFLAEAAKSYGVSAVKLNRASMEKLINYSWPGNIRELRNTVMKAALLCGGKEIDEEHIRFDSVVAKTSASVGYPLLTPERIKNVINECEGNLSKAARRLGISRVTLYKKMKNPAVARVVRERPLERR